MMLPTVLAFAASASAFLVVPEITTSRHDEPADDVFNILPIEIAANPLAVPPTAQSQIVKVPCAQCPGKDASVSFDVAIVDGSRLLYNGFEVFPNPDPVNELGAFVVTADTEAELKDKEELSYLLRQQVVDVDDKQGMMIVEVFLGIGKVGDINVKDMEFKVKLIVDPEWQLYIASVDVPKKAPACEGLWCEVKAFFGKLNSGKGCHRGGRMGHMRPSADGKHGGMRHGTERPHHSRPHSKPHPTNPHEHHRHGHGHNSFGRMIKGLVSHIIIPVVLGLFAGVLVALVAMVICTFIVRVIGLFRRPSNNAREVFEEDIESNEKQGLVDGQAPPPQYEEPIEKV